MPEENVPADGGKPKKPKFVPFILTKEKQEELEETYEDIIVLRGPEEISPWVLACRRPTRQETIAYKHHAKRDNATANEQLVRAIVVFPTGEDFNRQFARWPFFVDGVVDSKIFRDFVGITVDNDLK